MTRVIDVRVPDMGNFKDVAVIDVLVKPGDRIEPESPLVTLETEKATMDVPSTVGGIIERVVVNKGGKVNAGDVVVAVRSEDGAGQDAQDAAPEARSEESAAANGASARAGAAPSAAEGKGPTGDQTPRVPQPATQPATQPAAQANPPASQPVTPAANAAAGRGEPSRADSARAGAAPTSAAAGTEASAARTSGSQPIDEMGFAHAHASPSIRKLARELGVNLAAVGGTGFKGRITQDDVKAFVKRVLTSGAAGGGAAAARAGAAGLEARWPAVPAVDFSQFGPTEVKPLTRIQKISGSRLHASWVNLPHVTQFDEADITDLEQLRTSLKEKAASRGIKLTPLAFILRACVRALQQFPQVNASLDPSGENLVFKKYFHIGFAADTPNGLLVPVVRDADRKDIYEIARCAAELAEKARSGTLGIADMQGGSFTISSLGGIGGTAFTPIINAPEVAILGVSRSQMRPVYREGSFVPRLMLPLSFSYDHRVIDGALAARFTTFLSQTLADVRGLLEAVP
ncbi:MAG TPA: 2-oxo acid dehydrogenase subunit E2 [Steroidobacteraceae bacterium]|nr:2-oxo acid dehydrogenase subunit E2 [Steroidobacteraceae bacterium]